MNNDEIRKLEAAMRALSLRGPRIAGKYTYFRESRFDPKYKTNGVTFADLMDSLKGDKRPGVEK